MTPEEMRERARQLVADWPPPTPAQLTRLSALLRPAMQAATRTTRAAGNDHTADAA